MNVIVIGCGKTGSRLAKSLDERGYDVSVVDNEPTKLANLGEGFSGLAVQGMMIDIDVLRNAGCDNADIAIVVTASDNVNIMVARILEAEFGLTNVYVRILDVSRESVFKKFGIKTVCATKLETDILFNIIAKQSDDVDSILIGGSSVQFQMMKPDKRDIGRSPLDLFCKKGEMPFSLKRKNGEIHLSNEVGLKVEDGDLLIYAII